MTLASIYIDIFCFFVHHKAVCDIYLDNVVLSDIKGEVNNPGTYKLNKDERVIDVVNLAGGFTNNADSSNIN